jgi:hypothetical protein
VADGTTESVSSVLEPGNEPAKAQLRTSPRRTAKSPTETGTLGDSAARPLAAAAAGAGVAAQGPAAETTAPSAAAVPVAADTASADTASAAAAAAAVAAVSAALAATAATKAAHQPLAPGAIASAGTTAPSRPPVEVEGYVRAPGRDIPGLIRARHDDAAPAAQTPAPFAAASAAQTPVASLLPAPPELAPDDQARKYMRPVPRVPGITRAGDVPEESQPVPVKPHFIAPAVGPGEVPEVPGITRAPEIVDDLSIQQPPLFSNEGVVRKYEGQKRSGIAGVVGGVLGSFLAAGTALGHAVGSAMPGSGTGPRAGSTGRSADSPDFDRYGNHRSAGRGRRRVAGAFLGVGVLVAMGSILAFSGASVTAPSPKPHDSTANPSSGATANTQVAEATLLPDGSTPEPTVDPSAVIVDDESLAPGATRRPTAKPATPKPTTAATQTDTGAGPTPTEVTGPTAGPTSAPTAGPTSAPTSAPTAGPTGAPTIGPTPSPTPKPTATPTPTPTPTPTHTPTPTPFHTPTPTPTPSPTIRPTPVPTRPTLDTSATSPQPVGTAYNFYVFYIPASTCTLKIVDSTPRTVITTKSFAIGADGSSGPVPRPLPDHPLPAGTYTATATCTGTATPSNTLTIAWQ